MSTWVRFDHHEFAIGDGIVGHEGIRGEVWEREFVRVITHDPHDIVIATGIEGGRGIDLGWVSDESIQGAVG